jgi:hypothetical protein
MAGRRLYLPRTATVLDLPDEALASADALDRFLVERRVDLVGLTQLTAGRRGFGRFLTGHGFKEKADEDIRPRYWVFWREGGR